MIKGRSTGVTLSSACSRSCAALRAGDVWLESSRRYTDPETYLIPRDRWAALRGEVCQQLQALDEGTTRLAQREAELEALLERVDPLLGRDSGVRMEDGNLIVTRLEAEERPESAEVLERLIDADFRGPENS